MEDVGGNGAMDDTSAGRRVANCDSGDTEHGEVGVHAMLGWIDLVREWEGGGGGLVG